MDKRTRRLFRFQYFFGRLAIFIAAPLVLLGIRIAGFRVRDLCRVRLTVRRLMKRHPGPWLICANHLTLIDSVILVYAMIPAHRYMIRYRMLPWNIPEYMNFYKSRMVRTACFLAKCVPVVRGGDRERVNMALEKCVCLLKKGENLMIFPEGTRSRAGRVNTDEFPYGLGRLMCKVPECRVMCIYLRGDGQSTYSRFPGYAETFTMAVEECRPRTAYKGLRAQRDLTAQIIRHLAEMEKRYFAFRGQ